jgi:chromosome segregation ATPase
MRFKSAALFIIFLGVVLAHAESMRQKHTPKHQARNPDPVFCSDDPCPIDSVRPLPTYTRQDFVYEKVAFEMDEAKRSIYKLEDQKYKLSIRELDLIRQRTDLIRQRTDLIRQQLNFYTRKNQLFEHRLNSSSGKTQGIQNEIKELDQKIDTLATEVTLIEPKVNEINIQIATEVTLIAPKVIEINAQIDLENQNILGAAEYLRSEARGGFADRKKWFRDFYKDRIKMDPEMASLYKNELESLSKKYRSPHMAKGK